MTQPFFVAIAGLLGLVFGSFGNVVIWRFPRGESLSSPPSHCPSCDTPIKWYDNVPVVSWLLLRGRCRTCHAPIAIRYPLVELASAVLWVLAALRFGVSVRAVMAAALFYVLLLLSVIDIDTMRLPNAIVGTLALIGLGGVALSALGAGQAMPLVGAGTGEPWWRPLVLSGSGLLLGGGLTLGISAAYEAVRGRSGLGMGDVKLLGTLGLYVGLYVPMVLFFGSIFGAAYGLVAQRGSEEGMRSRIPFGPFLSAGAVVTVLWGESVLGWYLRAVGLS